MTPPLTPAEVAALIERHKEIVSTCPDEISRRLSEQTAAALLALQADAMRYRWLRNGGHSDAGRIVTNNSGWMMDDLIDAAIGVSGGAALKWNEILQPLPDEVATVFDV
jgi:hypothetical protein